MNINVHILPGQPSMMALVSVDQYHPLGLTTDGGFVPLSTACMEIGFKTYLNRKAGIMQLLERPLDKD